MRNGTSVVDGAKQESRCGASGIHGMPSQGRVISGWASRWVVTGAWRRERTWDKRWGTRGRRRAGVTRAFVGPQVVLEKRGGIGMAVEGWRIGREGVSVVPRGSIMIVNKGVREVSFGEAVAIQVGREVSLGVSVWERGCRNSPALFGSDVDECVEAKEGGTRVWMVSGRGVVGMVVLGGARVVGGVEDGEQRGGWVGVVEEGIDGAGAGRVGVVGVVEEGGDVHAAWGHGSIRATELGFTQSNYSGHVQRDIAMQSTRKTIQTAIQRRHRTQVPSLPSPADQRSQGPRPAPSCKRGTGRRRDAFAGCGEGEHGGDDRRWGRQTCCCGV